MMARRHAVPAWLMHTHRASFAGTPPYTYNNHPQEGSAVTVSSTPRAWPRWAAALALSMASAAFVAPMATAAEFPATQVVEGTSLVLQGHGTRYRTIFKVYDMALYLPRKVQTVEEALQIGGPVRLNFVALRDLPGTDLGLSFIRGLQSNATPEQMQRFTTASNRLIEIFSGRSKVAPGQTFAMEFVPGKGTTFFIHGEQQGAPVGDDEYFGMILRIWLGNAPADSRLKAALFAAKDKAA